MILFDVNVLVYAHREDMDEHKPYATWITNVAEGRETVALTSATVAGFVRIVTNPKIFGDPTTTQVALEFVEELARSPQCRWIEAGERWKTIFKEICQQGSARGNTIPDAHLAAIAIEHGCRLATADGGVARFPDLYWFHPLTGRESHATIPRHEG